jgi:hypothetical protein
VNSYTFAQQIEPDVASDPNGGFIVAWATQLDSSVFGISAQRFASDGMRIGTEFQVNTYTLGRQDQPAVAIDAAGGFMVVWKSENQDGDGYGIFGQQFASAGARIGSELQVNTYTPDDQNFAAIAAEAGGVFVVVWDSRSQDGDGDGIFGQRFAAGGSRLGGEFQVNVQTVGSQYLPAVAADTNGGFLVAWTGNDYDILARHFTSGGTPVGGDFEVTAYAYPSDASLASAPNGTFVAAWDNFDADGDEQGMAARVFAPDTLPQPSPSPTPSVTSAAPVLSAWGFVALALSMLAIGSFGLRRARSGLLDRP